MDYYAFGINHRTAPVEIREAFEFDAATLERFYATVGTLKGAEWLVLSTCNRTEVYLHGQPRHAERLRTALAERSGVWPTDRAFEVRGRGAVVHVLEVVSGIRSQILGDAQILSQVKGAYRAAATAGTLGPWMHRLMHSAFATAKTIITDTGFGASGASVARAALDRALGCAHCVTPATGLGPEPGHGVEGGHGGARPRRGLLLGRGTMIQLVLKEASGRGDTQFLVANRTDEAARELAAAHGAEFVAWVDRHRVAAAVDFVIAGTASFEPVLHAAELPPRASGEPVLLLDISVPRNIDPAADDVPGYRVFNIDQLVGLGTSEGTAFEAKLAAATAICSAAANEVLAWEGQHDALQPAIHTLYETFEAVRQREVTRNLHRFEAADREQVERLTRSIMQKLLAIPVVRLKTMAASEMDLAGRVEILNSLFARVACEE